MTENMNEQRIEEFAAKTKGLLQLVDLTKNTSQSYTVYSKDKLRSALQNPLTASNQKTLKELSQYLYYLNFQLRRIISYFASQIDLSLYTVVPSISVNDDVDADSLMKKYNDVCTQISKMNLSMALDDAIVTAWREDCVYLYSYYDKGESNIFDFTTTIMDPNYCKISSKNYDGTFNYAFDFSFFSGSNSIYLELWDKEFKKKYNAYQNDSNLRWQELDPDRAVCFKINSDQPDRIIPPLAALFESTIDSIDLRGLLSVKDQLSAYKLLVARIETLKNTNQPNDFAVDLDTCLAFYEKIAAMLPDWVGIALAPYDIQYVDMGSGDGEDNEKLEKSISNIYSNAGGVILDNKAITNSTGVKAALVADSLLAKKRLLNQIEAWVNRMMNILIPHNAMQIRYIKDVTPYTKDQAIKEARESATLGVPGSKIRYAVLMGTQPKDIYGMQILENDILNISDNWVPLHSTYTESSNNRGAPTKDDSDLSDEGIDTRDQDKNDN